VQIRRVTDGKVIASFKEGGVGRWESNRSVLSIDRDDDWRWTIVRCTIGHGCVRAADWLVDPNANNCDPWHVGAPECRLYSLPRVTKFFF
jgi:hypothetical protein